MDQSQKAAKPLTSLTPTQLLRHLDDDPGAVMITPGAEENRQRAATELSMIYELRESRAFQWFMKEFIDGPYRKAFDSLRSPHVEPALLFKLQTSYLALREVRAGMLEREIAHRELIRPKDTEIPVLREKLEQL